MGAAATMWDTIDPAALEAGFDPLTLPLDRFLSWLLYWMRRRLTNPYSGDTTEWDRFESRLYQPPKGVEATVGPWSAKEQAAGFRQFQREFSSGGG